MEKFDITSAPLKGRAVIEASAGTGKTYAIAGLFLRLVVEAHLKVNQILVVTFTVAATEELRDRIRRRLREGFNALTDDYRGNDAVLLWLVQNYGNDINARNRINEAIVCFDESAIFTIHGFCQKMLSENAFESNALFDTELISDPSDILIQVCRDFYRKHFLTMDPFLFSNPKVKDITPDYLLKLIKCLSIDPDFKIIPDNLPVPYNTLLNSRETLNSRGERISISACSIKELESLYSSIQDMWLKDGKTISSDLIDAQNNKVFNGNYIKKDAYEKACSQTTIYVDNGDCWNIAFDSSKNRYIEKLTNRFIKEKAKDVEKLPKHHFFDLMDRFIDLIDESGNTINLFCLELKLNFLKSARSTLNSIKMAKNVRAFDDLLLSMHKAVGNGETLMADAVRKRFSAALIDEFQDTDPLQYAVFTNIFKEINKKNREQNEMLLYLIGDPKQAIYGFRGADIYAYLKAKDSVDLSYTLGTNWRSDGGLVAAVNNLFDIKGRNPFLINGIGYIPVNHAPDRIDGSIYIDDKPFLPMNIMFIDKSLCNSKRPKGFITKDGLGELASTLTVGKISGLINLGAVSKAVIKENTIINENKDIKVKNVGPQDIAVLVRTNQQGFTILEKLRKAQIPAVIYGDGSVYNEIEAVEIERFIRAAANPSNEREFKTALITPFFGFSGNQILELETNETLYDSLQNEFLEYNSIWKKSGFISMFRYMLGYRGVRAKILSNTGGERKLTNYLHIAELLHIADAALKSGVDALINFLAKKRLSNSDKSTSEEYKLRLETDEKAVKIITVHKSKGLEFPIVFCPYLYYARGVGDDDFVSFHDKDGVKTLDIGSENFDENKETMQNEEFAESIRLAYVALTRAKYACFTVWGRVTNFYDSALSWLFHGHQFGFSHHGGNEHKCYEVLKDKSSISKLSWEAMKSDIDKIVESSNATIGVEVIYSDIKPAIYLPPAIQAEPLSCREFKQGQGAVPNAWRISSFSSIIAGKESHLPDHDEIEPFSVPTSLSKPPQDTQDLEKISSQTLLKESLKNLPHLSQASFFSFPKGARAGSCIHEIMENIDFTKPNMQVVKDKIAKFGFKDSETQKVEDMINSLLETNLFNKPLSQTDQIFIENSSLSLEKAEKFQNSYLKENLFLKDIKNDSRINEMEFFLPVGNINSKAIAHIMDKYGSKTTSDFSPTMNSLGFSQKGGYLKGFIDMVFVHNEKYYLLDWKTNHLGNSFEDYSFEYLSFQMKKSGYVLQYLIYTAALNAYLKNRVVNYNYETHFGGIFYLFMRGIKPDSNTGIYADCPDKRLVEKLTKALC